MKKLTAERKEYQTRKCIYSIKCLKKEQRQLIRKKRRTTNQSNKLARKVISIIEAPEEFILGFSDKDITGYPITRLKVLNFIHKIKVCLRHGGKAHITFKNTKKLLTSGTIIFVAELEKLLDKHPGKITCDYPEDDVVEQLFQHIGILEIMGLTSRKSITAENVKHWNYVHGTTGDTSALKELFDKYSNALSEDVRSGLFDSMSEAVTNSIQHAYPCTHKDKCDCEKNWWMFSQRVGDMLSVAMYDMGIGIPNSLERKPELSEWISAPFRRYRKRHDTILIDIAVESNRTSTRLSHRGKGLPDMLEFAKRGDVGGFTIFSRAGAFNYSAKDHSEKGRDFEVPINGTFIEWAIPIPNNS